MLHPPPLLPATAWFLAYGPCVLTDLEITLAFVKPGWLAIVEARRRGAPQLWNARAGGNWQEMHIHQKPALFSEMKRCSSPPTGAGMGTVPSLRSS